MQGTNPVARMRTTNDFLVHSMWYTLQGEGPYAGYPAIFVRLSQCNLRCFWCDTDFETGMVYTPSELIQAILAMRQENNCDLLVITGGEPLLQPLHLLLADDLLYGMIIQLETAGTLANPDTITFIHGHPEVEVTFVCSPKTPAVIPSLQNDSVFSVYWKYIIRARDKFDPRDGLPLSSTQIHGKETPLFRPIREDLENSSPIFVQPCDEGDPTLNQANQSLAAAIAMKHGYRLSIQLHKIVGVD